MEVKEFLSMQMMMHIGCASSPDDDTQIIVYHPSISTCGHWKQTTAGVLYMDDMSMAKFAFGAYDEDQINDFDDEKFETITFVCSKLNLDSTVSLTDNQSRTLLSQIGIMINTNDSLDFPKKFKDIFGKAMDNLQFRYMITSCVVVARLKDGNIAYDWTY